MTNEVTVYPNVTIATWPPQCDKDDPQLSNYWKKLLKDVEGGLGTKEYISNTDIESLSLLCIAGAWYPITQVHYICSRAFQRSPSSQQCIFLVL